MYRVLLPVDGEEQRALHQAKYVADLPNAADTVRATVLHVVPPGRLERADRAAFDEVPAAVDAADHLESRGVAVDRVVEDGGIAEQIVRTAADREVHEVVMAGRKRSGVTEVLLGSTVTDVFRSTERPVTITGTDMVVTTQSRRVLVPVDGDPERARHQAEYVSRLPGPATDIAATVLHVFPHQDYKGAPSHEFEDVPAAVEAADVMAEAGVTVDRVATGGEVTRTIVETATEAGANRIVLGGRKRSGVQKVLMGSTARDLLLSADRPVTITG